MRKVLRIGVLVCAAVLLFSCASNKKNEEPTDAKGRPEWVTKSRKSADLHYEVGEGKLGSFSTSRTRAEAQARDKIALWIQADVETVLKNYQQDSGIGDQREIIDFLETVSKQTAQVSLSGVEYVDLWESPDGSVFVLAEFPIQNVAKTLDSQVKSYARNEAAAFANFKANEAFAALEEKNK